ncbi:MAG: tetrahydrofolate dehydrogenase/cyclohydrolase catalytic domain-containing protein, partial [Gammaproteobacteria bacterium]
MPAQIIDGKKTAAEIRESVRQGIAERVRAGHRAPGLAVVLVGDDHASQVYVRKKREACEHAGIISSAYDLPSDT